MISKIIIAALIVRCEALDMIKKIAVKDVRYKLEKGAGSDAIHRDPVYSYAVTTLIDDSGVTGNGFAFTLGEGNDLVCKAAAFYAEQLVGKDIEELMNNFGQLFNQLSNEQQFRWLGPHKGVVHLALASVTNACYDLWAKKRDVPLWKLLIDLSPEQIVNTLDLSYLEDELTKVEAQGRVLSHEEHEPAAQRTLWRDACGELRAEVRLGALDDGAKAREHAHRPRP